MNEGIIRTTHMLAMENAETLRHDVDATQPVWPWLKFCAAGSMKTPCIKSASGDTKPADSTNGGGGWKTLSLRPMAVPKPNK